MRGFLCLGLLVMALPVRALDLPARALATLDRGRPWVEVRPDPDGRSGQVRAAIDIAAPQETIWALMLDCDAALRMVANLKSCRILDRDPQGRFDVREQVSGAAFLPSVRSVYRADYDRPYHIRFRRAGGDLTVLEGEWRLTPRPGGVRVTYEARASAPFTVPGWLARTALRYEVPAALVALKREAQAR
jgi:hypothetical protein